MGESSVGADSFRHQYRGLPGETNPQTDPRDAKSWSFSGPSYRPTEAVPRRNAVIAGKYRSHCVGGGGSRSLPPSPSLPSPLCVDFFFLMVCSAVVCARLQPAAPEQFHEESKHPVVVGTVKPNHDNPRVPQSGTAHCEDTGSDEWRSVISKSTTDADTLAIDLALLFTARCWWVRAVLGSGAPTLSCPSWN